MRENCHDVNLLVDIYRLSQYTKYKKWVFYRTCYD